MHKINNMSTQETKNSQYEEFHNSLRTQIMTEVDEIKSSIDEITDNRLRRITENSLIMTLSKLKNAKFFIKQFNEMK